MPAVLTDSNNRLRDPKHPTIGPIEHNVPGTGYWITHRYVHDGIQQAMRESYRYGIYASQIVVPAIGGFPPVIVPSGPWVTDYGRADVTHFAPVIPGGQGPVVYADDDGTVDVQMTDRGGQPWFMYRAQEGQYSASLDLEKLGQGQSYETAYTRGNWSQPLAQSEAQGKSIGPDAPIGT